MPKLCLGGAQIGTNYGATNSGGSMSLEQAKLILSKLQDADIKMIDTAVLWRF